MDYSEEDIYYISSNEEAEEEDEAYSETEEEAAVDNLAAASLPKVKSYIVLNEKAIKQRLEADISTICSVLFVPKGIASALLYHYNWAVGIVQEEWFGDEEKVRKTIGFFKDTKRKKNGNYEDKICGICFEEPCGTMRLLSAACGAHLFCDVCWKSYISTSINDGPGCLTLRCPEPSCGSVVCGDMVESLASEEDKKRYYHYLCRSYVEKSRERKWCPAPGCDFAIEYDDSGGSDSYDVTCYCRYQFCWNCVEECHRPVDCDTVRKWVERNSSEAANTTWILAYTKPCPKCKRPIEKNQGCSHMMCSSPCFCSFCWLCLTPFDAHSSSCNKYPKEVNRDKAMARKHLARYMHYYERWAANNKSRQIAMVDLGKAKMEHIQKLAYVQSEPEAQLAFVTEAWEQIVECRRVLKWTYAYGYYITEDDHGKADFFEYLQGEAESTLEKLHLCAEKEMKPYLNASCRSDAFWKFKMKLSGLITVTRGYFENLVRALENGLSEVEGLGTKSTNPRTKKTRNKY